ncbi:DinB family protein [Actinophytocola sp.]|uniref:DinB family protein n=1 Tax=Actinophytocola sp. TaxID=1872138 RepID=UPI002ECFE192
MPITNERWQATRTAVAATATRFVELVAASDPRTMATADWSVADTAAHVATIAFMYTHIVRSDEPAIPAIQEQVLATSVDTVADLNERALELFGERDPATLVERLRADVVEILRVTETLDPATVVTWLGDSKVPIAGVLAHLVNELQIHGRDIARATRTPWPVPPADAALFFEVFFVELIRHGVGHLLDNDEPPRARRIAVSFRSRHTAPVTIVLHNGQVSVEEPGEPTDVRIFFDPPTLNLMMFHRVGKARAALTGKVIVSGRRPWLLPAFLRTVRCP